MRQSVLPDAGRNATGRPLPPSSVNPVLLNLVQHASVRSYLSDPVSEDDLKAILTAAQSASTSSNLQMYSIIAVTDPERKEKLAELSGDQDQVRQAPLFLVFCPDLHRLERVCRRQGLPFEDRYTEMFIQAVVDAALAGQNAAVAAESLGYGICMIGGIRNRPEEAARLLGLPPRVFALFGMTVGRPARRPKIKPRLPHEVIFHREAYSDAGLEEGLRAYDAEMAASGVYRGRQVKAPAVSNEGGGDGQGIYGWCEHSARRLSRAHPDRRRIKESLERLGWELA